MPPTPFPGDPVQPGRTGASPHRVEEPHSRDLLAFGHPCPVSDLFGVGGRQLLARLELPEPWAGDVTLAAALHLIDELDHQIVEGERTLRRMGAATCRC